MKWRLFAVVLASQCLSGCFFVYVPGSVIDSVSDAVSGKEGQHCVRPSVVVGQRVRLPSGQFGTVQSLSGTSRRCQNPAAPIRAKIAP